MLSLGPSIVPALCSPRASEVSALRRLLSGISVLKRNMAQRCAKCLIYKCIFAAHKSTVSVKKRPLTHAKLPVICML